MILPPQPPHDDCPEAYGGCTCICHRLPGTKHIIACCHPNDTENEPLTKSC